MDSHELTTLDTGLRVVTERIDTVRSVAVGYFVGVGSRNELESESGYAHLLEHMLFRGNDRLPSARIDELFDSMGAEINAGTDRESTSLYARMLDRHLPRALDAMNEMIWRPGLVDLSAERQVVLEEIAMYEDEPQEIVFDLAAQAVFGDHPLGRPVIGREASVASATENSLRDFHAGHYRPENIVIAAAGAIEHKEFVALIAAGERERTQLPVEAADEFNGGQSPKLLIREKQTEQAHLCLIGSGIGRDDERRYALRVLDAVLGGSSSSRLFQEVRERRGLAYSVHSFVSHLSDSGQVGIYVGTRPERLPEAAETIASELDKLIEHGITAEELDRSREHAKGRIALARESTNARMARLGASVLFDLELHTVEEIFERIDAVDLEATHALAIDLFKPEQLSAAVVAPDKSVVDGALAARFAGAAAVPTTA